MIKDSPAMQEGIVVFLDALGVKGIWARAEPGGVISSWEEVISVFKQAIDEAPQEIESQPFDYHLSAFSDTIIFTLTCKYHSGIPWVARMITDPFLSALERGILLRGVISTGKFYKSDTLIIGPAIDEASEWYTLADWIGISTAPTASFALSKLEDDGTDLSNWFVRYNIPTKTGFLKNEWALAWPKESKRKFLSNKTNLTRGSILETFSRYPISSLAISKYKNTIDFFDAVCNMNDSQKQET